MQHEINLSQIKLSVWGKHTANKVIKRDSELLYVLEGSLDLFVLDKKSAMAAGDVVIVNSGESYGYQSSEDALFVTFPILHDLVSSNLGLLFVCDSRTSREDKYDELREALRRLLFKQLQSDRIAGDEVNFGQISEYFDLIEMLTTKFAVKKWPRNSQDFNKSDQYRKALIEDYMFDNYAQPISLHSMSEYLHLSEAYLSRLFKKMYGVSFTTLLRQIRLAQAMEELVYTDHPITKIAFDNGFLNSSYFNLVFKDEYGKTPTDFRKELQGQEKTAALTESDERKLKEFLQKTAGKETDVVLSGKQQIDVTSDTELYPAWNQLINAGNAAMLLRTNVQQKFDTLKDSLKFKYIRFWGLFSREMIADPAAADGDYYFAKQDELLDYIVNSGMKPFIDLEEKDRRVHKNIGASREHADEKLLLHSVRQWRDLFTATLRHWVHRYGYDEVSQWKIEVYYDGIPVSGIEPMERFFLIFRATYDTVQQYAPGMQVGGSGIWEEFAIDAFRRRRNFWKEWKKNAPKPDFVSLISYSYESSEGLDTFTRRSTDSKHLLHSIQQLRKEMDDFGWPDIQIIISEWNLTVSDRNYLNDSCYMGAYIAKSVIDVASEACVLGYYRGVDMTSEYYGSGELLCGGNGLLSREGIPKPSAYAIQFLNMLYPYVCGRGNNYIVTRSRRGSYGILCHNMKELNYYYYGIAEEKLKKENLWKCFDDNSALKLTLVLNGVADGNYRVKFHRVNAENGSVLDAWRELGYYADLSKYDYRHLRTTCAPKLAMQLQKSDHRQLTIQAELEMNEIMFIRVEEEV